MQRRKVLWPEPDGPIMHMTSFGATSRSMPRRTSSRPKLLCTASALTMGVEFMASVSPRENHRELLGRRRWRVKGKEHPAEALDRRQRQAAQRTPGEVSLDVVLPDRQDRRHRQVPDA